MAMVLVTSIVVLVVVSSVLSVIAAEANADSSASMYNTTAPVLDCESCLNDVNFAADFHEVAWSSKGGFVLISPLYFTALMS
jgi:hypothetical protein